MDVLSEIHGIAACLGKSENMRASAAVRFHEVKKEVYAPGNSAAQQLISAGYEPTHVGIWLAIVADPSYPREALGDSLRTGERLLQIGKSADPAAADKMAREQQAAAYRQAPSTQVRQLHNTPREAGSVTNTSIATITRQVREELADLPEEIDAPGTDHEMEDWVEVYLSWSHERRMRALSIIGV